MIQVIERAIDILEFVARHGKEPIQLISIAKAAKLSQPTCANIVKTLVERNFLENVSRKSGYILGAGAYKLTGSLSYSQDLLTVAKPIMEELTEELNETSLLGVIRNNKRFILHTVLCDQDLQVRANVEADVFGTASGRTIVAFLSAGELDTLLEATGYPLKEVWAGAQTAEGMEKLIKKIRKDNLAQTVSSKHIVGFAVPVYRKEKVIASLSVFLPESRLITSHKDRIIKALNAAGKKICNRFE